MATTGSNGLPGDGTVQLWDPATGRPFGGTFQTGVAFSPDGKLVATGGDNGTVQLSMPFSLN